MFIALEGPDGSGKSSLAREIGKQAQGMLPANAFPGQVKLQAFPTSGSWGLAARQAINAKWTQTGIDDPVFGATLQQSAMLLDMQSCAWGIRAYTTDFAKDASMRKLYIADRFYPSGLVYGVLDGLDVKPMEEFIRACLPHPDHLFICCASLETLKKRLAFRTQIDRYESEFVLSSIIRGYVNLNANFIGRSYGTQVHVLDTSERTISELATHVISVIGFAP